MSSSPFWVLDSGALVAFAHGAEAVGQIVVDVADADGVVAVPLICLVEAYSLLHHDEHHMLRMLRRNPAVRTVVPDLDFNHTDDCSFVGRLAQHTGRLGAGHAACVALISAAGVVTSEPDEIRTVLGDDWKIVKV